MSKTFYIKTFGCQMNVADTERMSSLLVDAGYSPAEAAEGSDIVIINGCSVREKAVHKAVSMLGTFKKLKTQTENSSPILGMGGCVGQLDKESLFKSAPHLDFVFGTDAIDQLPEVIHRVQNGERRVVFAEFDRSADYSTETRVMGSKSQAFVNIMKGCDKFCTYCIVPFTRGREKSRSMPEVLDDIARLVSKGIREVTLLGQNVNSYGKKSENPEQENFPALLRAIDQDPRCANLRRIRFTSSHPQDFSDELLSCYRKPEQGGVSRLAEHLHLPVQSGSNEILKRMGRRHEIEHYIEKLARLRELNPGIGLSTDLIVGFPGETDADFEQTIKLLDTVEYDSLFAFAYSERPGTKAAKLEDDVPEKVKNERLNHLLKHQAGISAKRHALRVGKTLTVLVESASKNQGMSNEPEVQKLTSQMKEGIAFWTARSSCNCVVNFPAPLARQLLGAFVDVKITAATSLSLQGELV